MRPCTDTRRQGRVIRSSEDSPDFNRGVFITSRGFTDPGPCFIKGPVPPAVGIAVG